ncbi:hypothetical protein [Acerihabitans arboris]|uniref:Uncharacterized protein n=1 Tax=Acerihabitans arboris TaxID=2691583 RepID=A0A845SFN3_9GAMM|nr:hypothetical protein [Acerihabitans arboris]NDL61754.1 hypothetical protein [Acerihabitans arboris]
MLTTGRRRIFESYGEHGGNFINTAVNDAGGAVEQRRCRTPAVLIPPM